MNSFKNESGSKQTFLNLNKSYYQDLLGVNDANLFFKEFNIDSNNFNLSVIKLDSNKLLWRGFANKSCSELMIPTRYIDTLKYKPVWFAGVDSAIIYTALNCTGLISTYKYINSIKYESKSLNELLKENEHILLSNISSIIGFTIDKPCYLLDINNTDNLDKLIEMFNINWKNGITYTYLINKKLINTDTNTIITELLNKKYKQYKNALQDLNVMREFIEYVFRDKLTYFYNKKSTQPNFFNSLVDKPEHMIIKRNVYESESEILNLNNEIKTFEDLVVENEKHNTLSPEHIQKISLIQTLQLEDKNKLDSVNINFFNENVSTANTELKTMETKKNDFDSINNLKKNTTLEKYNEIMKNISIIIFKNKDIYDIENDNYEKYKELHTKKARSVNFKKSNITLFNKKKSIISKKINNSTRTNTKMRKNNIKYKKNIYDIEKDIYMFYSNKGYIINTKYGGKVVFYKNDNNEYELYYDLLNLENINPLYENTTNGTIDETKKNIGCTFCRLCKTKSWIYEEKKNMKTHNLSESDNLMYYDNLVGKDKNVIPTSFIFENTVNVSKSINLMSNEFSNTEERALSIPYIHLLTKDKHPKCEINSGIFNRRIFKKHMEKDKGCGALLYADCLEDDVIYYFLNTYFASVIYAEQKYGKEFEVADIDYDTASGRFYKFNESLSNIPSHDKGKLYLVFHCLKNSVEHIHLHTWIDSKNNNLHDFRETTRFKDSRNKNGIEVFSNIYNKIIDKDSYYPNILDENSQLYHGDRKPFNELKKNEYDKKIKNQYSGCSFQFLLKRILGIPEYKNGKNSKNHKRNNNDKNKKYYMFMNKIIKHKWILPKPIKHLQPEIVKRTGEYSKQYLQKQNEILTTTNKTCNFAIEKIIDKNSLNKVKHTQKKDETITTIYMKSDNKDNTLTSKVKTIQRNSDTKGDTIMLLLMIIATFKNPEIGGYYGCSSPILTGKFSNTITHPELCLYNSINYNFEIVKNASYTTCCNSIGDNEYKQQIKYMIFTIYMTYNIQYQTNKKYEKFNIVLNDLISDFFYSDIDENENSKKGLDNSDNDNNDEYYDNSDNHRYNINNSNGYNANTNNHNDNNLLYHGGFTQTNYKYNLTLHNTTNLKTKYNTKPTQSIVQNNTEKIMDLLNQIYETTYLLKKNTKINNNIVFNKNIINYLNEILKLYNQYMIESNLDKYVLDNVDNTNETLLINIILSLGQCRIPNLNFINM